ncbi:MAG: phosphoglucosamine mutase [Candidatus Thorarchaeota archaeon]|nr:MAG: phosphoglucosamine mutase [Candidatus Thorarchaeota archaeon]
MSDRLFGTTGVRKVYGSEFDLQMALDLGKAVGTFLKEGTVLLARDARTTGLMVADALSAGIMSTGVSVVRAGIVPTPTLAFLVKRHGFDTGVMVTASHNPPEYTGVKFWASDSMGYTPEDEREIERIYESKDFQVAAWDGLGVERRLENGAEEHIAAILPRCDRDLIRSKNYSIVVDPGNGAACVLTPYLMQRLSEKVISMNGQLDGRFPGRRSEPDEESLKDLIKMVRDTGADLGIAHDGDADRVVFVTERGEVVRGDRVIALLAREMLASGQGKTVVTTVDSSLVLDRTVRDAGGETIRTPVGDIQVAMKARESHAILGGEACGVFILPEFHLAPEPFLAACKVLEMMVRTGESFGDLIGTIPKMPLVKGKVKCPNELKEEVMKALDSDLPGQFEDVKEVLTVDGLGVFLDDGWILVRPSGTEPVIRVTCEGPSEDRVADLLERASNTVESAIKRVSKQSL